MVDRKGLVPVITSLYINGNFIEVFPSEDLKDTIVYLESLGVVGPLPITYQHSITKYLDARIIISTPSEKLKVLLRKNDVEAYFSGNSMLLV